MKSQLIGNVVSEWGHKPVKILKNTPQNKTRTYLYNEVIDMVKKCGIPANITNKGIELPMPSTQMLNKLKDAGIHFETIV